MVKEANDLKQLLFDIFTAQPENVKKNILNEMKKDKYKNIIKIEKDFSDSGKKGEEKK